MNPVKWKLSLVLYAESFSQLKLHRCKLMFICLNFWVQWLHLKIQSITYKQNQAMRNCKEHCPIYVHQCRSAHLDQKIIWLICNTSNDIFCFYVKLNPNIKYKDASMSVLYTLYFDFKSAILERNQLSERYSDFRLTSHLCFHPDGSAVFSAWKSVRLCAPEWPSWWTAGSSVWAQFSTWRTGNSSEWNISLIRAAHYALHAV